MGSMQIPGCTMTTLIDKLNLSSIDLLQSSMAAAHLDIFFPVLTAASETSWEPTAIRLHDLKLPMHTIHVCYT